MKCPRCSNQTITFTQWKSARNAFRWTCPHCDADLKADRMVIIPFIFAVVLSLAGGIASYYLLPEELIKSPVERKLAIAAICLLLAGPLAALSWFKGGYVEK